MYSELIADLSPVASDAMAVATRELETIRRTADLSDVISLLRTLVEVAPRLERALGMVDALSDLADDIMPLTSDVMALTSDRLAVAQQKGYFEFAKAGLGIVDKVVAGFSRDDVEALGDNVVTILNTVKEITQPDMLVILQQDGRCRPTPAVRHRGRGGRATEPVGNRQEDARPRRASRHQPGAHDPRIGLGRDRPGNHDLHPHDNERRRRLMAVATIANHEVQIDDEGFMTNYDEWDEEVGAALAAQIGIEMTDGPLASRQVPAERTSRTRARRQRSAGFPPSVAFPPRSSSCCSRRSLRKKMSYIAGLPKPKGCV